MHDTRLSIAARGLHALAMSLDDASEADLAEHVGCLAALNALLDELERHGYACRRADREIEFVVPPLAASLVRLQRGALEPRPHSVVYYLRRSDGLIKIGCTRHLPDRMDALTRQYGPLTLCAFEPGGFRLERERHDQFAEHRAGGEWFRPAGAVSSHIATLVGAR